jgi:hypothetical protein
LTTTQRFDSIAFFLLFFKLKSCRSTIQECIPCAVSVKAKGLMKPSQFCSAINQIDPGQFFQGHANQQSSWISEWKKHPNFFKHYVRVCCFDLLLNFSQPLTAFLFSFGRLLLQTKGSMMKSRRLLPSTMRSIRFSQSCCLNQRKLFTDKHTLGEGTCVLIRFSFLEMQHRNHW